MHILDNPQEIARIDSRNMSHEIIHMPQEVLWGYEKLKMQIAGNFDIESNLINRVIICADGADLFVAEIIKAAFAELIPIEICQAESIAYFDANSLVIILDYLGDNNLLKNCLMQAKGKKCSIATISSKDIVESLEKNCLNIKLNSGYLSRRALPFTFTALIRCLEEYQIIPNQSGMIKSVIASLITRAGALAAHVDSSRNFAKISAMQIDGKIPLIISENPKFRALAKRWKTQINRNAKSLAFYNSVPQINSCEKYVVNGKAFDNFMPIILRRFNENEDYRNQMNDFVNELTDNKMKYLEFYLEGKSVITEYFSMIYLGDMISCYLAILNEIDPSA